MRSMTSRTASFLSGLMKSGGSGAPFTPRAKSGDKAGGDADMAVGLKSDPNLAQDFAKFGIK